VVDHPGFLSRVGAGVGNFGKVRVGFEVGHFTSDSATLLV